MLEKRLIRRDIEVGIEIPPHFGRDLKKGHNVPVSALIDGANTFRAGTVEGYVNGAHANYLMANPAIQNSSLFNIEPRFRYNPTLENIYAMAPAIPAMLLILFPSISIKPVIRFNILNSLYCSIKKIRPYLSIL